MYPKKFKNANGSVATAANEAEEKMLLANGYSEEPGRDLFPAVSGPAAPMVSVRDALLGETVIYNHPGDIGSKSGFYCVAQIVGVNDDGSVSIRTSPPKGTPELLRNIRIGASGDVGKYQYPDDYQKAAEQAKADAKKAEAAAAEELKAADQKRRADLEAASASK